MTGGTAGVAVGLVIGGILGFLVGILLGSALGESRGFRPPRTDEEQRPSSKEVAPKRGDVPATEQERDRIREQKLEAEKPPLESIGLATAHAFARRGANVVLDASQARRNSRRLRRPCRRISGPPFPYPSR